MDNTDPTVQFGALLKAPYSQSQLEKRRARLTMALKDLENNAYILWIIRAGIAKNWETLCAFFGLDSNGADSEVGLLLAALRELSEADLIDLSSPPPPANTPISVSPRLTKIRNALRISLTDLAHTSPDARLLVEPCLVREPTDRYRHDLFVLMPFVTELRPVYDDHLRSVATRLNLSIARADDFFSSGHIVNQVWTAILDARIVLADCTGRNPNVFYELGLAHAVGKPTILLTQREEDVPFDLRHNRYIKYAYTPRGMDEFEVRLEQAIQWLLGEERGAGRRPPQPNG
jgi:hypothetical protein